MKVGSSREREAYYREAESWAVDRLEANDRSRRLAWLIAFGACAVALLEALALIALAPLKTVVPYTLMVDRQTGFVQALKPLDAPTVTPDAALTQSFLVQYVVARETFDVAEVQADYRKVALWSAEPERSAYVSSMQPSNPTSPLSRYPRSTVVAVTVKSVSPLGTGVALVRFDTQRREAGGGAQPTQAWVAVVRFRFSRAPLQVADRFTNPLGFQVTSYRRDQEQLPAAADDADRSSPAEAYDGAHGFGAAHAVLPAVRPGGAR